MDKKVIPRFKPDEQVTQDGKAECYWCDKIYPVEQMRQEMQYEVRVYICKNCG